MANINSGTATSSFNEYLELVIKISGIVYNSAGGSNLSLTPAVRGRGLVASSFVVSGTWATSTAATVQLQGSEDNTNWVSLGVPLSASSGTVPQAGSITGADFVFSFYRWTLSGGDAGTLLQVDARFMQSSP